MASWTDTNIPQFNPYVQQLPVEAMVQVGMQKQKQYEEGIQKIQTNIDNVAGLDVMRDVDKTYLQSKLNELGNNLKTVAAGDFSNFQLVNSVNGMTTQIVKDKNVQTAVSSTAKIRQEYAKRAELEKKGLTDKNNDDYFNKFVSEYTESKVLADDAGNPISFNASYVPHTDIMKKMGDALSKIGEKSSIVEELFVTENGKPKVVNGHFVYADVKTIDKLVTNKEAVKAAINNVLLEGDVKQQLGIDGWATYRNTDVSVLLEPMVDMHEKQNGRLEQASLDITALLNSTNISVKEKTAYLEQQKNIEEAKLENNKSLAEMSTYARDNPDAFKQQYYTRNFKQDLLTQFTKEETSRTFGANEGMQQQNWRQDYAFKVQQEKDKIAYQNQTLELSRSSDRREWMKFSGDYGQDETTGEWYKKETATSAAKKKAGTKDANIPLFSGSTAGDKVSAINIMQTDITTLSDSKEKLAFTMYADLTRVSRNDSTLTDAEILASAKNIAKKQGISTQQYLDRWASNMKNNYVKNGLKPPPNLQDEINDYTSTAKTLKVKMAMSKAAETAANLEAGVDSTLLNLLKNKKTINFNNEGTKITLEPNDMLGLLSKGSDITKMFRDFNRAQQREVLKRTDLNINQRNLIANWHNLPWNMRNTVMAEFFEYNHTQGTNVATYRAALEKSNELFNQKLSKIVGVSDVTGGSLPMYTAEDIKASVANVSAYISVGGRSYGDGDSEESVQAALANPTAISWTGKKPTNAKEEWTGSIIVKDAKGGKHTITNVNHDELQKFTNLNLINYQEKPIQDLINLNTNTKSTNSVYMVSSPDAWKGAYFQGSDVNPEIKKAGWEYRADAIKSGAGYRLVNYIKAPGAKEFNTIYGNAIATDENTLDFTFKTATPAELNNLYLIYLQNQNK